MSVGDLVVWIGFPGASIHPSRTGETSVGMIVKIWKSTFNENDERIDVLWGSGKIGRGLYPQTIEVINESR